MSNWKPIESAPKGGGAEMTSDPNWVEPPKILLAFESGEIDVGRWDYYYAKGGHGYEGGDAWIGSTGERLELYYDPPTHWQPMPSLPEES